MSAAQLSEQSPSAHAPQIMKATAVSPVASALVSDGSLGPSLGEPPLITLLRLGEYKPQQSLKQAIVDIRENQPDLCNLTEVANEWTRAQQLLDAGDAFLNGTEFEVDELVALIICSGQQPDFFPTMNQTLCNSKKQKTSECAKDSHAWRTIFAYFFGALSKLPSFRPASGKLYHTTLIPRKMWNAYFQSHEGHTVCFYSMLRATTEEQWNALKDPDHKQDAVPCILEFHNATAKIATGMWSSSGPVQDVYFVLPYMRAIVRSIHAERAPDTQAEVFRVRLDVARSVEPLASIIHADAESSLAGALLLGLHTSTPEKTTPLLSGVSDCFNSLSTAVKVKSPEAVTAVWKGYFECLTEGISTHCWKDMTATVKSNIVDVALGVRFGTLGERESIKEQATRSSQFAVDVARVAVSDFARAAQGVTKRVLGYESCLNRDLMIKEDYRREEETEELKWNAVAAARDQVNALELETLTDPEAFIRFMQHDPVKAFEVAPFAVQAYLSAVPAQQVFIFAKLIGLVTMAGRLLRGDPQVQSAFDSSFPLSGETWDVILDPSFTAAHETPCPDAVSNADAQRALATLRLQQLHLAFARLMIVGGAPDVGKSTFLKKVFGLDQLAAGLNREARTDQLTFMLHPDGDEQHCPVYLVDTPGFGDGEHTHRNDMARLLLGAGSWLPDGTTLLWVIKAGRSVRQEADELLRKFASSNLNPIVVVTHIDKLFEDRYRELGPLWREGDLEGVPTKSPLWAAKRKVLMQELKDEVSAGIENILGSSDLEIIYTCLGGWMSCEDDDEDEFSQSAPWQWARQELNEAFGIKSCSELRKRLDAKLGFS
jgi:GTP-binding protein EngB required for normal cell division